MKRQVGQQPCGRVDVRDDQSHRPSALEGPGHRHHARHGATAPVLGQTLDVDPHSIHAQVIGEHGDSEVVLWSSASVGGLCVRDWPRWDRDREPVIADEVRPAAYEIIRRKGATNHAIGLVTANLLR